MAILIDSEISELCKGDTPLLSNFVDWEHQLQPSGFDFTIAGISMPTGGGIIRAEIGRNVLAKREQINCDSEGYFHLSKGYYTVEFNEVVRLPVDVMAVAYTRSTLIRYGGQIVSGVWDAGFHGKSYCGLAVNSPEGICVQHNAMLMQMVFVRLSGESAGFQFNHLHKT